MDAKERLTASVLLSIQQLDKRPFVPASYCTASLLSMKIDTSCLPRRALLIWTDWVISQGVWCVEVALFVVASTGLWDYKPAMTQASGAPSGPNRTENTQEIIPVVLLYSVDKIRWKEKGTRCPQVKLPLLLSTSNAPRNSDTLKDVVYKSLEESILFSYLGTAVMN